jgi:hypothetical protein
VPKIRRAEAGAPLGHRLGLGYGCGEPRGSTKEVMFLYVLLMVGRQKGSPRNMLPRVGRGQTPEDLAPVRWTASYVRRDDTVTGDSGVLVFSNIDRALEYAGIMMADGHEIALVEASDEDIQKHAFGGDPNGVCIVDADWTHPPGLPVEMSKLEEWLDTSEATGGTP